VPGLAIFFLCHRVDVEIRPALKAQVFKIFPLLPSVSIALVLSPFHPLGFLFGPLFRVFPERCSFRLFLLDCFSGNIPAQPVLPFPLLPFGCSTCEASRLLFSTLVSLWPWSRETFALHLFICSLRHFVVNLPLFKPAPSSMPVTILEAF